MIDGELKDSEVFLDLRGVSHQRNRYSDESNCLQKALKNTYHKFVGFVIYKRKCFDEVVYEHKQVNGREDFEAELEATPLDENDIQIPKEIKIYIDTPGSPAHADINYINPSIGELESPKIAIRSFSRKLYKRSTYIKVKDCVNEENVYCGILFSKAI